jgi:hypothetical protein
LNGGYALNENLAVNGASAGQYAYWYGGVSLGRLWHHFFQTTVSYSVQRQTTNGAPCPVLNCGSSALWQVFGVTVDMHLRPIAIE